MSASISGTRISSPSASGPQNMVKKTLLRLDKIHLWADFFVSFSPRTKVTSQLS